MRPGRVQARAGRAARRCWGPRPTPSTSRSFPEPPSVPAGPGEGACRGFALLHFLLSGAGTPVTCAFGCQVPVAGHGPETHGHFRGTPDSKSASQLRPHPLSHQGRLDTCPESQPEPRLPPPRPHAGLRGRARHVASVGLRSPPWGPTTRRADPLRCTPALTSSTGGGSGTSCDITSLRPHSPGRRGLPALRGHHHAHRHVPRRAAAPGAGQQPPRLP